MHDDPRHAQRGMALLAILVLMAVLMVLIAGFASVTSIETATTRSSMRSFQGFYAAEAGLNARADQFRQLFVGEALPSGTGPTTTGSPAPCFGGNQGSGDFACSTYEFQNREVKTYVEVSTLSTNSIVVPRGELFQNQFGTEYHYVVYSQALNTNGATEASLEMHFKSRTLPLFQWAAFYDKDLELLPTPGLVFNGPLATNADMYLGTSGTTLDITGQVTSAHALYIGRKDSNTCLTGTVRANNPDVMTALPACSSGRRSLAPADVVPWGGMVGVNVDPVSVPGPEILDRVNGAPYWTRADLRIVLNVNGGTPVIEVRNADDSVNNGLTNHLSFCGSATTSTSFYDNREGAATRMLDLDVQSLLTCNKLPQLVTTPLTSGGTASLVFYLGVDGPGSTGISHYGVRLKNASELTTTLPTSNTTLNGLTVASDQPVYIQGNYNVTNKKPAAVMGDVINVLSNSWTDAKSTLALTSRTPTATTINAALFAGTDTTGGAEGTAGQSSGGYNGGVENYIRLHENWNGAVTLTYRGSFVSLFRPRRVAGAWAVGSPYYTAPIRDWDYDNSLFEDPTLLPPMTPNLVYLRQELFVRKFDS
jgi:type II secretory pathway pseudopilin PulG